MVQHSWQQLNAMKLEDLEKLQKSLRASTLRRIRNLSKVGLLSTPATTWLARKVDKGVIPKIARIEPLSKSKKPPKAKRVSTAKTTKSKIKKTTLPKIPTPKPNKYKKSDIIRQIMEYENFLSLKTSTVRGMKNFNAVTDMRLGIIYQGATENQKKTYWELYDEIREDSAIIKREVDSNQIQRAIVASFIGRGYSRKTSRRIKEVKDILDRMRKPMNNPFNHIGQFKR